MEFPVSLPGNREGFAYAYQSHNGLRKPLTTDDSDPPLIALRPELGPTRFLIALDNADIIPFVFMNFNDFTASKSVELTSQRNRDRLWC